MIFYATVIKKKQLAFPLTFRIIRREFGEFRQLGAGHWGDGALEKWGKKP